jgi:hypothetical protein
MTLAKPRAGLKTASNKASWFGNGHAQDWKPVNAK